MLTTERSAFIALAVVMITGGDCYEIRSICELDARWAEWFDRRAMIPQPDGDTILRGPIVDQAQLHGVLMKIRDPGLKLVSVNRIDPNTQEY